MLWGWGHLDKLLGWIYSLFILIVAAMGKSVDAFGIGAIVAVLLVVSDYITGFLASMIADGQGFKSKKMRWSMVKMCVYVGTLFFTIAIGASLYSIEKIVSPEEDPTKIWVSTLYFLKGEVMFIIWVESVSIVENLRRIKDNPFLKWLHYILAVEFIKKIPKLAELMKEKDTKNICAEFEKE